jgi:hypothetical protein
MTAGDATVTVAVGFEGKLEKPEATITGTIQIVAAPLLNGTNLELMPLDSAVTLQKVSMGGITDEKTLPELLQETAKPFVNYIISRIGAMSIPIDLGIAKQVDLAEALREVKEVNGVENGRARIFLAFGSSSVLATKEGLYLIGSAKIVPQAEMEAATGQLKQFAKELKRTPVKQASCTECQFAWREADQYLLCLRRRLDCEADHALGIKGTDNSRLTPTLALALRELAKATDTEGKETYESLRSLLSPSLRASRDAAPGSFEQELAKVRANLIQLRGQIEPDASFAANETVVALRTDLLANSINQIGTLITPTGRLQIDRRQEDFHPTIKSPPSAQLNCEKNKRVCESTFTYKGTYEIEGCASGCGTRNCARIFGKDICVNGVNLDCQWRKTKCEAGNEARRLKHEADKAAEEAKWTLARLDCVRLSEMELAGCQLNQRWLNEVGDKELGRVDGNAVISDAKADAAFHGLQMSAGLDTIQLGLTAGGNAGVDASFVFTPLNAGHLGCIAQWGGNVKAQVLLPPTEISLKATLDKAASKDALVFRMDAVKVGFKMSPAPGVALLSQNPHMALLCPGVGAFAGAAPVAAAIALPLMDTLQVEIPSREIRLPIMSGSASGPLAGARPELRFGSQSILVALKPPTGK